MNLRDIMKMLSNRGDMIFSMALLGVVFILVLPLPSVIIDLLLTVSIALSVLIILTIAYIKEPTDFFVFPSILLFITLFRLGLNVATTRSILIYGDAGNLINAFGQFVVQGNVIVGIIVFVILTIINFIVITKGAGRVAEVSARFTLDAMPGKQMSIDADLNSGLISEQEARDRRKKLETESSFFGAMDGASKFVRGDAIAGIIITSVNLIGGFAVGILQMNLSAGQAMEKFTLLSVGDGLASQIPALIVSTAAGILVTRSSTRTGLGEEISKQLLGSSNAVMATGVLLLLLGFVPGFPTFVLLGLGSVMIALSRVMVVEQEEEKQEQELKKKAAEDDKKKASRKESVADAVGKIDPLCLELGLSLLPLVQGNMQNLLDRLSSLRKSLSAEMGVVVPPITVRDNAALGANQYRILLRGHDIAQGELYPGQLLAMGTGTTQRPLRGRVTKEPAFGLPATWIMEGDKRSAERLGFAVVDPLAVLVTHFSQLLRNHLADLLSRQEVQRLLDKLKQTDAAVVGEIANLQVSLGTIHRVLQNLLQEELSVRELPQIIEKLCDQVIHTKNPDELSEACRKSLTYEIARHLDIRDNKLQVIALHPELEQILVKCVRQLPMELAMVLEPDTSRDIHQQLSNAIEAMTRQGITPVILCSAPIRLGFKRYFDDAFPGFKVVAYQELSPKIIIEPLVSIMPPGKAAAA